MNKPGLNYLFSFLFDGRQAHRNELKSHVSETIMDSRDHISGWSYRLCFEINHWWRCEVYVSGDMIPQGTRKQVEKSFIRFIQEHLL